MERLIKLMLLFLLILTRAILGSRTQYRSLPNISLSILNNVTSIALVPHSTIADNKAFPLFNPCYNPFTTNHHPDYPVEPYWLKGGEFHVSALKQELLQEQLSLNEYQWIHKQALPRLTFLWSLYELANNIHTIDSGKWQVGLKQSVAHAVIRTIGYQKQYGLQLEAHYFSDQVLLASQRLNSIHILILYTLNKQFIPLLIFNPPEHLLGLKAEGKQISDFWNELTQDPHTLIGDPRQNMVFAPYHHYHNAFNFSEVKTIGIFSSFGQFDFPSYASSSSTTLIKRALKEFQKDCVEFSHLEEFRFLNRSAPLPIRSQTKLGL